MKLAHTTPCKECPWRKDSLQGYLGGNAPEVYADAAQAGQPTPCHMADHGVGHPKTCMCAGSLSTMANSCMSPNSTDYRASMKAVGKRDDTFSFPFQFYEYHAKKQYVHPFMRKLDEQESDV